MKLLPGATLGSLGIHQARTLQTGGVLLGGGRAATEWEEDELWTNDPWASAHSSGNAKANMWQQDNAKAWSGGKNRKRWNQPPQKTWDALPFTTKFSTQAGQIFNVKSWAQYSAGEEGVFACDRNQLADAWSQISDKGTVALLLGGQDKYVQRHFQNKRLQPGPKTSFTKILVSVTNELSDVDAETFKQATLACDMDFLSVATRPPETPPNKPTTAEFFVQAKKELPKYFELQASTWRDELEKLLGTRPHEIRALRPAGQRAFVCAVGRFPIDKAKDLSIKSGKAGVFLRPVEAETLGAIGVVWLNNLESDDAYKQGLSVGGFLGIIPSSQNGSWGLRFEADHLSGARARFTPNDPRFGPDNSHVTGERHYVALGWNEVTDPSQVQADFQSWGWPVVVHAKRHRDGVTCFDLRSSTEPPAGRLYTANALVGYIILEPKSGSNIAVRDKSTAPFKPVATVYPAAKTTVTGVPTVVSEAMEEAKAAVQVMEDKMTAMQADLETKIQKQHDSTVQQVKELKEVTAQQLKTVETRIEASETASAEIQKSVDTLSSQNGKQFEDLMKAITSIADKSREDDKTSPDRKKSRND